MLDSGTETILLVADDEPVRVLIRTILRCHGYYVLDARNVNEALLICDEFPTKIDLLLTDVAISRMSEQQFTDRSLLQHDDLKVLFMSSYGSDARVHYGILASGAAFIEKPITREALVRKVREVLDGNADAPKVR